MTEHLFILSHDIILSQYKNSNWRNDFIMKRSLALAAVLALVFSSAAFAYDFGAFTMDVADGWTPSVDGPTAVVAKNDNTASLSVTIMPAEGTSAKDFATAFVEELKKSFTSVSAPSEDTDGSYMWEMTNANGVKSTAALAVEDGNCKLVVMTGLEAAGDDIVKMLGTIKEK